MKKLCLTILLGCGLLALQAQVKVGFRTGIATTDVSPSDLTILGPGDAQDFKFAVENANYGIHAGLFLQAKLGPVFIQPEVLFNSSSVDFRVDDIGNGLGEKILRERYQNLDIPVMTGLKLGPLRLQAGPVAHIFLDSSSEIVGTVEGYEQNFRDLNLGWQAGIGLDIWKFVLDVKYEGNFNKFGDHINVLGNAYNFDQRPTRTVMSLGIAF